MGHGRGMAAAALLLTAGMAWADQKATQIHIEARFLEATSEGLRDLGADIGWGLGLSVNFASSERAAVIPFLGASWDRITGDNGAKLNLSGFMAGFRFRTSPNTPLDKSQTAIVLGEGFFENRYEDDVADGSEKGMGFDIGLEVGPMMKGKGPLWRFLYSLRPETFGKKTQLMIITVAFPIVSK